MIKHKSSEFLTWTICHKMCTQFIDYNITSRLAFSCKTNHCNKLYMLIQLILAVFGISLICSLVIFKCSHTKAYGINVCERMPIRLYTFRVRQDNAVNPEATLFFRHVQNCSAFASVQYIYTRALIIRQTYAEYVRGTVKVRCSYVIRTLFIRV